MAPKRSKRLKGKQYSRSIVIKTSDYQHKELFLELAMPLVSSTGLKIDTRVDRIELELFGNYDQVDPLIDKLRNLETMIYNALNPGLDGRYYYDNRLLTRIFAPPLGLKLFATALKVCGFEAKVEGPGIRTTASLDEIQNIYSQVKKLRSQISSDLNRDMTRFLIGLALETNISDPMTILQQGVDMGLIEHGSKGYFLTMDPQSCHTKILHHLSAIPVQEVQEETFEDVDMESIFFRGGKVVFLRNGEEIDEPELDRSFYDQPEDNNSEDIEG